MYNSTFEAFLLQYCSRSVINKTEVKKEEWRGGGGWGGEVRDWVRGLGFGGGGVKMEICSGNPLFEGPSLL